MVFFPLLFSLFFGQILNLCDWLFSISGTALFQICTRQFILLNPTSKYIYRDSPSVPNSNSITIYLYLCKSWFFFLNCLKLCGIQNTRHWTLLPLSVIDYFAFVSSFAHNQIFYYISFLFWCPHRVPSLSFISLTHLCISLCKGRNWIEQKIGIKPEEVKIYSTFFFFQN